MPPSPYQHMQDAVDIVPTSPHSTNKVAATITGKDTNGAPFALSRTNHWPEAIETAIGRDTDIGNSSGTIHAETASIISAPKTEGATIFITDPPCPNCMKNMAEAGISQLYIDHKGFDKDWAKRRGDSFENMSMRIAAKAGIDVYVIYRKEQRFEIISQHAVGYKPAHENPPEIKQVEGDFETLLKQIREDMSGEPFALAIANGSDSQNYAILVDRHPTVGYTNETVGKKEDKYSFILQPINRLLMVAAKEGLSLDPDHLYSSRSPTSRELVNMVGAGLTKIQIGNMEECRDDLGLQALQQLTSAGIF